MPVRLDIDTAHSRLLVIALYSEELQPITTR